MRIIPAKFCQEEMSFKEIVDRDRTDRLTDNGLPTITIAHLEPMAQVS